MPDTDPVTPLAGRPVRRMGFGAMQLPGPGVFGPPKDRASALAILRRVVDAGVNHIDTAQFYGPDVANELIREALHPYSEDLVIASKVGARRDDSGQWLGAQRPEELRAGWKRTWPPSASTRFPWSTCGDTPAAKCLSTSSWPQWSHCGTRD